MSAEKLRELKTLASVCPELNMANYTEDDVRHLNDWAIEISLLVEQYALSQQPAQATQAEVTDAQLTAAYLAWCKTNGTPESFARAILALRPERVPMTGDQWTDVLGSAGPDMLDLAKQWADNKIHVYQVVNKAEKIVKAAVLRGITAQAKKEQA